MCVPARGVVAWRRTSVVDVGRLPRGLLVCLYRDVVWRARAAVDAGRVRACTPLRTPRVLRTEAGASENQSGETRVRGRLYILTGSLLGLFPLLSRVCMRFDRFSSRRQGSRSRNVIRHRNTVPSTCRFLSG